MLALYLKRNTAENLRTESWRWQLVPVFRGTFFSSKGPNKDRRLKNSHASLEQAPPPLRPAHSPASRPRLPSVATPPTVAAPWRPVGSRRWPERRYGGHCLGLKASDSCRAQPSARLPKEPAAAPLQARGGRPKESRGIRRAKS